MFWVMAVCILMSVFDFLGLVYGSGVHQADLPPSTATMFVKVSTRPYSVEIHYPLTITVASFYGCTCWYGQSASSPSRSASFSSIGAYFRGRIVSGLVL